MPHRISAERLPDCDRVPRNCSLMLYAIKHATQKCAGMEVSLSSAMVVYMGSPVHDDEEEEEEEEEEEYDHEI